MSSVILQILANGLIAGSLYALVAAGFSLIFSTNKFVHFAHGSSVTVAGYLTYLFFTQLGFPFWTAAIITIILTSLFGYGMYRLVYLPLQSRKASNIILLIASIGLLILFENLLQIAFGSEFRSIAYGTIEKGMSIAGATITKLQLVIIFVSIVLLIVLHLMKRTRLGRNMRAVADNPKLARIIGINDRKIAGYSFLIGSALAGIAGILVGLEQNLHPTMGTGLMVKGFTRAVVGGVTSVPGAVLGSYILGLVENIGVWFVPSGYKDAIAFVLLLVFLLWKPSGLFGIEKGVKQ